MDDKIQSYRQPMVTVTGVFLGFVLTVANSWVTRAFTTNRLKEVVIAIGLCACIALLLIVLYRILNMDYPKNKAQAYYKKTLLLFITGIGVVFLSLLVVMIESYVIYRL